MKRLNSNQKRLIISIIAMILIITMVLSIIAPFFTYGANLSDDKSFSIEAEIGFNGNYKVTKTTPFQIKITNNSKKDFKGEIQIPVQDDIRYASGNEYSIISSYVEIPSKSSKTVNLKASFNTIERNVNLNLIDTNNNIIKTENIIVSPSDPEHLWVGMLSDSQKDILYLKPSFFEINGENFLLDKNTFPDDEHILSNYNVIIINNFDTSSISESQKNVLVSWISNGGILIIGTGIYKNKISSGFSEILSDNFGKDSDYIDEIYYSDTSLYNEFDKKLYEGIKLKSFGSGFVFIHDIDLSENMELDNSFLLKKELSSIYSNFSENANLSIKNIKNDMLWYTNRLPNFEDKMIIFILLLVFIYTILIGPILYYILSKKDKKEKAIKIIPMISIILTVFIYALSFNTIYKKPIGNIISFIDLDSIFNNNGKAYINVNAISPDKNSVKIDLNNVDFKSISDNYGETSFGLEYLFKNNSNKNSNDKLSKKFNFNDNNTISIVQYNMSKWENNFITLDKDISFNGNLDMNIQIKNNEIVGTIKNNTGFNFEDIIMGINNSYIKYENLKNGENIELGKDIKISYENDNLDQAKFDTILTDGSRNNNNIDKNRLYELELRQDLTNGIIHNINDNKIQFNFIAFNSDNLANDNITLNNKKVKFKTNNVFLSSKIFNISDFEDGYIPYGVIKPILNDDKSFINEDFGYSKLNVADLDNIQMSFNMPKDIDIKEFEIFYSSADAEIYNYSAKSWEKLTPSFVYSQNDVNKYISENSAITIQLENILDYQIDTPKIKVKVN